MLLEQDRLTICAALQNGLGFTNPCRGLNQSVIEVSAYIKEHPVFEAECRNRITSGYQLILSAINDSASKGTWDKWRNHRSAIDNFITHLNTWESICKAKNFKFEIFTMAIMRCKTIEETATAVGMDEVELRGKIWTQSGMVQWLIQNGYQI